jgi:hypothetical protein
MVALISFPKTEEFSVSRELEADNVLFAEGKCDESSVVQGMSVTALLRRGEAEGLSAYWGVCNSNLSMVRSRQKPFRDSFKSSGLVESRIFSYSLILS